MHYIKIVGEIPIIDVTHTDIEINNLICIWQCQDGAYELRNNPPDPFKLWYKVCALQRNTHSIYIHLKCRVKWMCKRRDLTHRTILAGVVAMC